MAEEVKLHKFRWTRRTQLTIDSSQARISTYTRSRNIANLSSMEANTASASALCALPASTTGSLSTSSNAVLVLKQFPNVMQG